MHHERWTKERGLLPIEARRVLWDRLWARLLAPPPETGEDASGNTGGANHHASDALPVGGEGR